MVSLDGQLLKETKQMTTITSDDPAAPEERIYKEVSHFCQVIDFFYGYSFYRLHPWKTIILIYFLHCQHTRTIGEREYQVREVRFDGAIHKIEEETELSEVEVIIRAYLPTQSVI